MEDFIYIIVLIAWVAFAFYRKSQKKSAASREAQQKPQPQSESSPFPTLEEILLGTKPSAEPEPETSTFTIDETSPESGQTAFEREYNRLGITSIEQMIPPVKPEESKQIDIQEDELLLEEDLQEDWRTRVDLRQAIIYSEILNSPYV